MSRVPLPQSKYNVPQEAPDAKTVVNCFRQFPASRLQISNFFEREREKLSAKTPQPEDPHVTSENNTVCRSHSASLPAPRGPIADDLPSRFPPIRARSENTRAVRSMRDTDVVLEATRAAFDDQVSMIAARVADIRVRTLPADQQAATFLDGGRAVVDLLPPGEARDVLSLALATAQSRIAELAAEVERVRATNDATAEEVAHNAVVRALKKRVAQLEERLTESHQSASAPAADPSNAQLGALQSKVAQLEHTKQETSVTVRMLRDTLGEVLKEHAAVVVDLQAEISLLRSQQDRPVTDEGIPITTTLHNRCQELEARNVALAEQLAASTAPEHPRCRGDDTPRPSRHVVSEVFKDVKTEGVSTEAMVAAMCEAHMNALRRCDPGE